MIFVDNFYHEYKNKTIPRYTYPCYEYLNSIDWKNADVFEYGCGHSTIWWKDKDVNYTGVEDNEKWYDLLKKDEPSILLKKDLNDYVNSIYETDKKFDVIVIDGKRRFNCVEPALNCVKKDGMVVLDNSDMYINSKIQLDNSDLIPIHFHGFKFIHDYPETTSCYIGRDFKRKAKSILPMGGYRHGLQECDLKICE
tara:strand:- start:228 stop:815 length:588 start_codon:yes stop_codon:yes gene_type:complete